MLPVAAKLRISNRAKKAKNATALAMRILWAVMRRIGFSVPHVRCSRQA